MTMTGERLFLGIDGGGTRTCAVLARDDGIVLGRGEAGPSNPRALGDLEAARAIENARRAAFAAAEREVVVVARAGLGVAGLSGRAEFDAFAHALAPLHLAEPGGLRIDHDLAAAWTGAFLGEPGTLLLAGTGSAAFAQDGRGARARAGGMGAILDDAGSATWIGLAGLRRLVREDDGREASSELGRQLRLELELEEIRAVLLLASTDRLQRPRVAALAPTIAQLADDGEPVARAIIEAAAEELLALTRAVVARVDTGGEVALLGGALRREGALRRATEAKLRAAGLDPEYPKLEADLGALLLALPSTDRRDFGQKCIAASHPR
jgi:N-acetylglucosamine kinase-like BadF-type ATPase